MDNEQVAQPTAEVLAVEKEARAGGWVPKEEFRDGDHWVDAETFVRRGKEINPILRKNNENLLKQLADAKGEIAEVKKVAKEFEKFQKEVAETKVRQLESELKELKEQKKVAITSGDGEAVVGIDEAIDAIKEQQREAKVVPPKEEEKKEESQALDPVLLEWMDENKWFTEDSKYTKIADAIGVDINQRFPKLVGKKFLEKLDEELAEVLPERYKKTVRGSPVEGTTNSNSRSSNSNKHTYDNLPTDAKQACDRFIKQGFVKSREAYCADYDWN